MPLCLLGLGDAKLRLPFASPMELRQLRYFIAVATELNFTRAARSLQIAQSPLSRQIRVLENDLGVQLLERNSSKVFLTHAGRLFLKEAQGLLQLAAQAVEVARHANAGEGGTIRLGIGKGLGDAVSRVIKDHLRSFPGVEIDVADIPSGFQSDGLVSRKIDVGFLRLPVDERHIASDKLFDEKLSVVMRRSNRLAKCSRISLKQVSKEPLLVIARDISPGMYDKTLDLYRSIGVVPHTVQTQSTSYDEAGAILVDSGKGVYIAVGRNPFHPSFADRLIAIPLSDRFATVEAHIAWRRSETSKTTLNFVEFARNILRPKSIAKTRVKAGRTKTK
jgi:DNA-binding transcriptional LysR family regulator